MSEESQIDSRIPVNIITGFLGSGKTTLLNKWVNTDEFRDTLVLINEFGDVGLDHELVQAVDDTVVLLGSGCICCTLQGELIQSLATNLVKAQEGQIPKFNRVLIETTGLADPAGVIGTINNDDFCLNNFRYDGTVTVLDGQFVRQQIEKQYEAVKQMALADIILVSKTDLIDSDEIEAIYEIAGKINHSAKIYPVVRGNITPKIIEEIGPYKAISQQDPSKVRSWLAVNTSSLVDDDRPQETKAAQSKFKIASPIRPAQVENVVGVAKPKIIAHTNIDSFAIVRHEPLNSLALLAAINAVQQQYGDSILRLKGIVEVEGQPKPVIVHGVQGQLYPVTDMDEWPEGDHISKIVFIVRESVLEQIKHIFTQAIDHPDESTINYYRELIAAAGLDNEEDVETINLVANQEDSKV